MGRSGGFFSTPYGQQGNAGTSIANTAIAITKLMEARDKNKLEKQERVERIESQRLKQQKEMEAARERTVGTAVQEAFGSKNEGDVMRYTEGARRLAEPGAQVSAVLKPVDPGQTPPNLTPSFATTEDVRNAARQGAARASSDTSELLKAYPEGPERDRALATLKAGRPITPGGLREEIEKQAGTSTAITKARREEAALGREPLETRFKTAETVVKEAEAGTAAPLRATQLRKAVAETTTSEIEARYKERLSNLEIENRTLDSQIKTGTVKKQPLELEKLRAETGKMQVEMQKSRMEMDKAKQREALSQAFNKTEDPVERRRILGQLAVASGHEGALITDDRETQKAYERSLTEAEKVKADVMARLGKDDQGARLSADAYNRQHVAAAAMAGSKTVEVMSVTPRPNWRGGETMAVSTAKVPTGVAKLHTDGTLGQIAMGQVPPPQGMEAIPFAGQALAWKVTIERSYGDSAPETLATAIQQENAPPEVKTYALNMLKTMTGTKGTAPQEPVEDKGPSIPTEEQRTMKPGDIRPNSLGATLKSILPGQGEPLPRQKK